MDAFRTLLNRLSHAWVGFVPVSASRYQEVFREEDVRTIKQAVVDFLAHHALSKETGLPLIVYTASQQERQIWEEVHALFGGQEAFSRKIEDASWHKAIIDKKRTLMDAHEAARRQKIALLFGGGTLFSVLFGLVFWLWTEEVPPPHEEVGRRGRVARTEAVTPEAAPEAAPEASSVSSHDTVSFDVPSSGHGGEGGALRDEQPVTSEVDFDAAAEPVMEAPSAAEAVLESAAIELPSAAEAVVEVPVFHDLVAESVSFVPEKGRRDPASVDASGEAVEEVKVVLRRPAEEPSAVTSASMTETILNAAAAAAAAAAVVEQTVPERPSPAVPPVSGPSTTAKRATAMFQKRAGQEKGRDTRPEGRDTQPPRSLVLTPSLAPVSSSPERSKTRVKARVETRHVPDLPTRGEARDDRPGENLPIAQGQDRIRHLLTQAEEHIRAARFTQPPDHNAWQKYKAVLRIDPHNAQALRGLDRLVGAYLRIAEKAMAAKHWDKARNRLGRAEQIRPGSSHVKAMRARLARLAP